MTEPVKPRRAYRSQRRKEQAEETRARILAAAQRLLVERGFAGATIAAIADEAGTAQETVYQQFGNKRALLAELVQRAVRGDDPAPILEQPGPVAVSRSSDPAEQLRLFAEDVAKRLERAGPLMQVLADAGHTDPDLVALHRHFHQARRRNLRAFTDGLAATVSLRVGRMEAADTVWALASPELHTFLTRTAGWSRNRYTAWLADTIMRALVQTEV